MTFTVDGATKTATLSQGSGTSGVTNEPADSNAAVAARNSAAGTNVFPIDATTHKITVASTSSDGVRDSTNAGTIGFTAGVSGTAPRGWLW